MKTLYIPGRQGFALLFITSLLIACNKDISDISVVAQGETAASVSNNGTTITQTTFTATAAIGYCHGENIVFTGIIENKINTTADANGVLHYTRHWTVKGLSGTGAVTGTQYDVIGGSEMFGIKDAVLNSNGTLNLPASISESDIVIHQGTVVFVSSTDGSRVVARHIIRKVPGQNTTVNHWICAG